jgi:hypothetical protein
MEAFCINRQIVGESLNIIEIISRFVKKSSAVDRSSGHVENPATGRTDEGFTFPPEKKDDNGWQKSGGGSRWENGSLLPTE